MEIRKYKSQEEYLNQQLDEEPIGYEETNAHTRLKESIQRFTTFIKKGKVLVVGCRDGWVVEQLNGMGFDAVGIDINPKLVEHAKKRGRLVYEMDMCNIQLNDFDGIFCAHSLEHSHFPNKALREFHRVAKSSSIIYIEIPIQTKLTPNHSSFWESKEVFVSYVKNSINVENIRVSSTNFCCGGSGQNGENIMDVVVVCEVVKPLNENQIEELKNLIKESKTIQRKISELCKIQFGGEKRQHPKHIFYPYHDFFVDNVKEDDTVLDLGCGSGLIGGKCAKKCKKVIAIDVINQLIIDLELNSNLEFIKNDIETYDFNNQTYTIAIMSQILEHLKDPVLLLKKLKCDKIIIGVPSKEKWQIAIQEELRMDWVSDPGHYREYTKPLLRKHLEEAGFKIEYIEYSNLGSINCIATKK